MRRRHAIRQAVVVIHGMGEQRPLKTLRSFITAAVPPPTDPSRPLYWSKPDSFGNEFELRRFTVPRDSTRPGTDVFEYYWADKMDGTTLRHLRPLAKALLLRLPWRVPGSLVAFYWLGWVLVATLVFTALRVANALGPVALLDGADVLKKLADGHGAAVGWSVVGVLVTIGYLTTFAINSFGDVARYLDSAPGNVGVRHAIKSDGLDMLRKIQNSEKYDRIVLVGHSLGSIIALDLMGYLWGEQYWLHDNVDHPEQTALQRVEALGPALAAAAAPSSAQVAEYRDAQRDLWLEQRRHGNPWLISDFISAGSPLTHAALLLARSQAELRDRQARFELPTNPPVADDQTYSHPAPTTAVGPAKRKTPSRVLNAGAMFACTRWTNVWFPCRYGLFGDPFGGRLQPLFGRGVVDLPVTEGPKWRFLPVFPHTAYWRANPKSEPNGNVALIRDALDLNSNTWLRGPAKRPTG